MSLLVSGILLKCPSVGILTKQHFSLTDQLGMEVLLEFSRRNRHRFVCKWCRQNVCKCCSHSQFCFNKPNDALRQIWKEKPRGKRGKILKYVWPHWKVFWDSSSFFFFFLSYYRRNCDLVRVATKTLSKWVFHSTGLYFFRYTLKTVFLVTQRD